MEYASLEALALYFALRKCGITAELEKSDGFKKVDIAIEAAKLYIEVDGNHHYKDHNQAIKDLQRTFYSLQNDYVTIRVPNTLIKYNLEHTCNYFLEMVRFRQKKVG